MDDEEFSKRYKDRFVLPQAYPLMKKAFEIHDLVRHILDAAPVDDPYSDDERLGKDGKPDLEYEALKAQMRNMASDASLIPAKIAGAEGADLYDLRMENATIIRKAARDVVVGLRGLEMFGYNEPSYFDLLRDEMDAFRKLFVAWVQAFDKNRFITDDWGLFNPPGVGPDDDIIGDLGYGDDEDDDDPFGPEE